MTPFASLILLVSDLFLVLKEDKCYFFPTRDDVEWLTLNDQAKHNTETYVKRTIETNDPKVIIPSNIEEMRDVFGDVLADYRCKNSQIFLADPAHFLVTTAKPDGHNQNQNYNPWNFFAQGWHHLFGQGR